MNAWDSREAQGSRGLAFGAETTESARADALDAQTSALSALHGELLRRLQTNPELLQNLDDKALFDRIQWTTRNVSQLLKLDYDSARDPVRISRSQALRVFFVCVLFVTGPDFGKLLMLEAGSQMVDGALGLAGDAVEAVHCEGERATTGGPAPKSSPAAAAEHDKVIAAIALIREQLLDGYAKAEDLLRTSAASVWYALDDLSRSQVGVPADEFVPAECAPDILATVRTDQFDRSHADPAAVEEWREVFVRFAGERGVPVKALD